MGGFLTQLGLAPRACRREGGRVSGECAGGGRGGGRGAANTEKCWWVVQGVVGAPRPRVSVVPICSLFRDWWFSRAWASVLTAQNSTPCRVGGPAIRRFGGWGGGAPQAPGAGGSSADRPTHIETGADHTVDGVATSTAHTDDFNASVPTHRPVVAGGIGSAGHGHHGPDAAGAGCTGGNRAVGERRAGEMSRPAHLPSGGKRACANRGLSRVHCGSSECTQSNPINRWSDHTAWGDVGHTTDLNFFGDAVPGVAGVSQEGEPIPNWGRPGLGEAIHQSP